MYVLLATDATEDSTGSASYAERLLKRFGFSATASVEVVHVIPTQIYLSYALTAYLQATFISEIKEAERWRCERALHAVTARVAALGYQCRAVLLEGAVVAELVDRAEYTSATIIAVNGVVSDTSATILEGGVVRGLVADAPCSLLIAKPTGPSPRDRDAPLHVLLATDHSAYIDRCIDRFIRFDPRGIGLLTIVTAYPKEELSRLNEFTLSIPVDELVKQTLANQNAALIEKLRSRLSPGIEFASRVVGGDLHTAIAGAMTETNADVLILGARGHGFIERLTLGSASYKQAVSAPYSVLVLRD